MKARFWLCGMVALSGCVNYAKQDPSSYQRADVKVLDPDGHVGNETIQCTRSIKFGDRQNNLSFGITIGGYGATGANSGAPGPGNVPSLQLELVDDLQFRQCVDFVEANLSPSENAAWLRNRLLASNQEPIRVDGVLIGAPVPNVVQLPGGSGGAAANGSGGLSKGSAGQDSGQARGSGTAK